VRLDAVLDAARAALVDTTNFVRAKNLVSLPDEPVEIIEMLARKGACVTYADPFVPQLSLDCLKLTAVEPSPGALAAVDCVLILTNHSRFDYAAIAAHAPLVVDTRNAMKDANGYRHKVTKL